MTCPDGYREGTVQAPKKGALKLWLQGPFLEVSLTMSYFHGKYIPLSSALRRFTVLFGMGRSGTTSLWSSGKEGRPIDRVLGTTDQAIQLGRSRHAFRDERCVGLGAIQASASRTRQHGYRIKPHGQLVLVSLTHYCASTPSLSTSWSSTTLQGTQGAREDLSSGEFHA